ncbi:LPXTG cell wall anchor domain-containing protein [Streptomyces sp. NPDC048324]|uniref:LPXTG cell wall anchor domain-containing protein n=1 Tax=Streptomyces sp. NPDC048324 TaxID=3157205 RepID=UPI00342F4B6F
MTPPPGGGGGTPPQLPHTGSEGLLAASGVSALLIGAGSVLYRRGRSATRR